jgi:hypothetical protein
MFFVHCVGGCVGQKKPDQGNSWWSQLIIDLPDETPTASCCPLSFHIVSECFMCFFPNGSPCFTMLHHFSHVFIMFSPLHHVSQCFRLFYIGKWWWKHWEMVVSPMFHLCPSFFHRLTELLLTISETFVHHFFSVFHTCWTDVSRFATQWLSHFVWHLHIYQGSSWHSPFQNVTMFRHQLTKSCVTLARHRAKWRPRPSAGRER